jgi:hypothetical protein
VNLETFLFPFTTLSNFLKASEIVNLNYSSKLKNYETILILFKSMLKEESFQNQKMTNESMNLRHVVNFIQKLKLHMNFYGYEYIINKESFILQLYKFNLENKSFTRVLTVGLNSCIFCEKKQPLIIKRLPFEKDVILYGFEKIGNWYCKFH